ncbi:MAG: hypothetical protein Roseis2KO_49260 [Roseivirga sp.]
MKKLFILVVLFPVWTVLAQNSGESEFSVEQAQNQEIYIQFDKPFYLSGETVWYSLFNITADAHRLIFGRRFMEMALIDRNKQIVIKERIKVEDGRSAGQFELPSFLTTGNYMLVVTYPFEEVENFIYRKVIPVFNPNEIIDTEASENRQVTAQAAGSSILESDYVTVVANKRNYGARERASIDINLKGISNADLSVVVRERRMSTEKQRDIRSVMLNAANPEVNTTLSAVERTNYRENKPLDWSLVSSHGSLLYELLQLDSLDGSSIPYAYVAEDQVSLAIFEVNPGLFVLDGTQLTGDKKTFYFNNFSFSKRTFNSMTFRTTRDMADNEGVMNFSWIVRPRDYSKVFDAELLKTPPASDYAVDYAQRKEILGEIYKSQAYEAVSEKGRELETNRMKYQPIEYKKTEDYSEMASVPEFLKEINTGMKVWNTPKKKDVKINFSGGRYESAPLFLVDGIPTLDLEKVFEIPMNDIDGIGVMKDPQNKTQQDQIQEIARFGYFGSNGVIVIKLKEGVTNPFQEEFNALLSTRLYIQNKLFPQPDYNARNRNSPSPDFRPVLYWEPLVKARRGRAKIDFFTSDDVGVYDVIVEGIGENGEVIHARQSIVLGNPVLFDKN